MCSGLHRITSTVPSASRIVISAAGSGKTTRIVDQALAIDQQPVALITYTRNNVREIQHKIYARTRVIPSNVEIVSWYSFLLRELARPYRSAMHDKRIEGIRWEEGRSAPYAPETKISEHYFHRGDRIYSDKIAKFICQCNARSGGAIMRRLKSRFSHLIIDEVQDMAGYDLDLLELILKSDMPVTLVGDHRQATFATNSASKNKAYAGPAIINKFVQWERSGLVALEYECHTHRCNQVIADLGDSFFPKEPKTVSKNSVVTGHDGIFLIAPKDVASYVERYRPQILRYSAATSCAPYDAMNFGESKGLTFDRVLVYPHGKARSWIASGLISHVEKSAAKMYVAITRARHSVAFVYEGKQHAIPASWFEA